MKKHTHKKPIISLIACIGKNRELGYNNRLIWRIPADLNYFKKTTTGHAVIMGQRTFESIGRSLPDRINIVLSDQSNFKPVDIHVARSMKEALGLAEQYEKNEVFFIGGANVYDQAIKFADKLYLTMVDSSSEADVFFPDYKAFMAVEKVGAGVYNDIKYEFMIFTK